MKKFPHYRQNEAKDCGPTCIKMIAKHYGKIINTQQLRTLSETTRQGSSLMGLSEAVESLGFKSLGVKLTYTKLLEVPLPCIVHWNKNHFVVVYKIKKNIIYISDPAHGLITYTKEEFLTRWIGNNATDTTEEGIVLLVEPTPLFYQSDFDKDEKFGFRFIFKYLFKYKRLIIQLIIGLLAGSLLQLILPFLTQSIVDVGIKNQDLNFVYLVLFAQLFLFVGKASLDIIRSWILLHLSTRINISLISDFFIKLMKLPISFFDVRMTGDLLQRINDHKRIERILTTSSLTILFSFFNLIVFSLVLGYYSLQILGVFAIGSVLYFGWVLFFFKRRKELDYKRFSQVSQEQSKVIELINGMQEIKLHNAERRMRWNWEYVQARLFKIATKSLALEQTQSVGSNFINELKNMFITILSAKLVIDGENSELFFQKLNQDSILQRKIVADIENEITYLYNEIEDSTFFIETLEKKIIALKNSIHTREFLGNLPLEYCPECLSKIKTNTDSSNCKLCKEPIDESFGVVQARRMELEIGFQINESKKLLEINKRNLLELKSKHSSEVGKLHDIQKQVNSALEDVKSFSEEAIDNFNNKKGFIEGEIFQFRTMLENAELYDKLLQKKNQLGKEVNYLKAYIFKTEKAQTLLKKAINEKIKEEGIYLLNNDLDRQDEFKNANDFFIDYSNNIAFLSNKFSKYSASSNFYLKVAARFSIFLASLHIDEMRYPRFIFADNMEDKGIEMKRAQNLQNLLIKRVNDFDGNNYQMIYTTSYITEELNISELVVGEYYTKENPSLKNIK